jgi:glycine/D-amino acid oxidase-like deaminating enzyme/nitrite reductase/ring-hydroxylating ferredoxin subunit
MAFAPTARVAGQEAERPGTGSYWLATSGATDFPALRSDTRTEVAVVGAGLPGLMAAYLLAKEGVRVTVLDRFRVAMAETGHTTAHITHVVDSRLRDLIRIHGEERTKASWDSGAFATDLLERIAREEGIDCGFARVDGVLYGNYEGDEELLAEEAAHAGRFGYAVERIDADDVPFASRAALRFPRQAKFHPRRFLLGLVEKMERMGVAFHEGTEVVGVDDDARGDAPVELRTSEGAAVRAEFLLACSNVPFLDKVRMHTKLFPYRSYVVAAGARKGLLEDALYWSTFEPGQLYAPYYYTRVEPGADNDVIILGGEDHKVGQAERPDERWTRLLAYLRGALREDVTVEHRWSGQIIETLDGLPFIGPNPGSRDNVLIATGFSGNGMTFGALAGWMMAERVLGHSTDWDQLYEPSRKSPQLDVFLRENKDMFRELLTRPFQRSEVRDVADISPGDGAVVSRGGRKLAVHRTREGELKACSAICTHLQCAVRWNRAEQSWDCPCHGSRFTPDGAVVNGPAVQPLEPASADDLEAD